MCQLFIALSFFINLFSYYFLFVLNYVFILNPAHKYFPSAHKNSKHTLVLILANKRTMSDSDSTSEIDAFAKERSFEVEDLSPSESLPINQSMVVQSHTSLTAAIFSINSSHHRLPRGGVNSSSL